MKQIWKTLAGVLLLASCQNEQYIDPAQEFSCDQAAYIASKGPVQIFVEEGKEYYVKDVKVGLTVKENKENPVKVEVGDPAQLEAYNQKNATAYLLLPKEMYEAPANLDFAADMTQQILPIHLKDVHFSLEGDYALPVRIQGESTGTIPGENEAMVILEKRVRTKVLKVGGREIGSDQMFPQDFKVNQWTLEVMLKRSAYIQNNMAIAGTKLVQNAGPMDEIYTRFGDVTIETNQLQIKTGASQIDVAKDKFAAKPNEWYMITFVYDGKNTLIYVNGDQVAEQQIREGAYGLIGFWLSGANEYVREVRFWETARNAKEVKEYVWKTVNPNEEGLLLYYPCNGKKRNHETGEITEDETKLWNWATSYSGDKTLLDLPLNGSQFDDNNGNNYVFPFID